MSADAFVEEFLELRHEHPYLKVLATENLPVKETEHFYQPTDGDWPIYGITVVRSNAGFNISVSVKHGMDEWWECCDYHNPIPYELAPIMKGLI
jgi:hypothetical protein